MVNHKILRKELMIMIRISNNTNNVVSIKRIFNDIDIKNEPNLYYVALTRGMKKIVVDKL